MSRFDLHRGGIAALARIAALRAAVIEAAVGRQIHRIAHESGDGLETVDVIFEARQRCEQAEGVGMTGIVEDLLDLAGFDDLTRVHDGALVADIRNNAEVVGDEEQRRAEFVLQVAHQVQDLRLDRNVQRGGR